MFKSDVLTLNVKYMAWQVLSMTFSRDLFTSEVLGETQCYRV